MAKNIKTENDIAENSKRLKEIAEIKLGKLSDDEVAELLVERQRLTELEREYERLQKEEEERLQKEQERLQKEEEERLLMEKERAEKIAAAKKKKQALAQDIERLGQSISPDKPDDELLTLIVERKRLEKELRDIETEMSHQPPMEVTPDVSAAMPTEDIPMDNLDEKKAGEVETEEKILLEQEAEPAPSFKESLKEEFGPETIEEDLPEGGELQRYLNQLKNNTGALGTLLQEMPADAKKNKVFMLRVAEIDPAYAMHYADQELKKNESFNIKVASMKNQRHSGNALAEMLPEARTSRVVLAAVKQDYRNVKFVQPNMADYDEMMSIAKKVTLERLNELKSAADILLIIPRLLQQDKQFMAEANEIVVGEK